MTWADLTCDWPRAYTHLKVYFRNLDEADMAYAKTDRDRFAAYLASSHNLTRAEAQEAIDDFLLIQTIWGMRFPEPQRT